MLISMSIENWMSFRGRATISMVASEERKHVDRLPRIEKHKMSILPVISIYRGKASVTPIFFKALHFAKTLVINGTQPESLLAEECFRLDNASIDNTSRLFFYFLIDEKIYGFSFSFNKNSIIYERLVVLSVSSHRELYVRDGRKINFEHGINNYEFFKFVGANTQDNQLFLTKSVDQKIDTFRAVYDWFDRLQLVDSGSYLEHFYQYVVDDIVSKINSILHTLDLGITHISKNKVQIEHLCVPDHIMQVINHQAYTDVPLYVRCANNERVIVTYEHGELVANKLMAHHKNFDGTTTAFCVSKESSGAQRVIDLLPAFFDLSAPGSKKVIVIEDIDSCLHPLLARRLLESYLASCSTDTRAQLLLSTNNAMLMDKQLLRLDEMHEERRTPTGISTLFPYI